MTSKIIKNQRKLARNFKIRVEMTENTPLNILEEMLIEMFDEGVNQYLKKEKKKNPEKSQKQILIEMYRLRERLKGRRYKYE
jgi:hypothetical protein